MKRDSVLDFLRGFAALWIIIIHTVCKSGFLYAPFKLICIVLIIDVPLFIFISGMCFSYQENMDKVLNSLKKIYIWYLKFLLIYWIITLITNIDYFTIRNVISSLFFKFNNNSTFYVVRESMWFMPMYICVSLLSSSLIVLAKKHNINIKNILFIVFVIYGIKLYYFKEVSVFTTGVLLYSFVYILGYYVYNHNISLVKEKRFFGFIILLNILLLTFSKRGFFEISALKFEYDILYLIYQMISLTFFDIIRKTINVSEKNLLCLLGRNAIICYFAQGISSSLMNYIVTLYDFHWLIKLPISIVINLILAIFITIALYNVFKLFDILNKKIRSKFTN